MLKTLLTKYLPPFLLFLFTFALYVHNLSASVYGGDSGDFLSAIAVKGVPHPSGYPLYTLLGILASYLPIHQTLAWKVDLLSALFSSLTVVLMYMIVYELLESTFLATVTALTLAFVFPFWFFAEVSEVFALHSFFLLLLFYLGLLLYTRGRRAYVYLFSFCTGLSFANHELTLFILPTLFIFVFAARKKIALTAKIVGKCFGLFILGLTPYLYIPIAASHNPPINWDHASTIGNFFHLLTRADYGWRPKGITNTPLRVLEFQQYLNYLVTSLSPFLIGFALFGVYSLLRRKQFAILSAILAVYLLSGPFFAFYRSYGLSNFSQGADEKFYPSSMLFLLLLVPFGVHYIVEFLVRMFSSSLQDAKSLPVLENIFLSLFVLAPVWLFFSNITTTDLHTNFVGDLLGKDILTPLPKNSYVAVSNEDDFLFNSRYMQYAYGIRKDVRVLTEAEFEEVFSPHALTRQGSTRIRNKEKKGVTVPINGPVFIVTKDYNELSEEEKVAAIPFGLLFQRVLTQDEMPSREEYLKTQQAILASLEKSTHRMPTAASLSQLKLIADIPLWYARACANTGLFLIARYQDYETAQAYFQKALAIDPNTDTAYEGMGDYALKNHDCQAAEKDYEKATEINFLSRRVYQKLYIVVDTCLHDRAKTQELREFFSQHADLFGTIETKQK